MISENDVCRHHKKRKRRESVELFTEESYNCNGVKTKHRKKKKEENPELPELLAESHDTDKNEFSHHKKKKKKEKPELLAESHDTDKIEFSQLKKKKKKEKTELFAEPCDTDKNEFSQLKKKKKQKEKTELLAESHDTNKKEFNQFKKKKKGKAKLLAESHDIDKNEFSKLKKKKKKKEKAELIAESHDIHKNELKKKKKKKEKTEISDQSQKSKSGKNCNGKSETCTSYTEPVIDFNHKHKHEKKNKKLNENNLNEIKTFAVVEETEVPAQKQKKSKIKCHISETGCSKEVEVNVKSKKCKENAHISQPFNALGVVAKKQKHQVAHTPNNNSCLEINYSNHQGRKNKGDGLYAEELPEFEPSSNKHKKKKKHSENTDVYTIFNQNDSVHSNSLKEGHLKHRQNVLRAAKETVNICYDFEIKSSNHHGKEKKKNEVNIPEVSAAIIDATFPTKHRKKHSDNTAAHIMSNETDFIPSNSLNKAQLKDKKSNMYSNSAVVDCAFENDDINFSSSHKKSKENNLNTTVNENFSTSKKNSTDNTQNCTEIDISDILLNKEISYSPVLLHSIENKSNYAVSENIDETFHILSSSVHKHKWEKKHNQVDNCCYDFEMNSSDHHKVKHKENSLSIPEVYGVIDKTEIFSKKHKRKKKHPETWTILNENDYTSNNKLSKTQLKNKEISSNITATEADIDHHELEIKSSNHHRKKNKENCLNVAEASAVTDETETFPKTHKKKKKKHSNNTEASAVLIQNHCTPDNNLSETLLQNKKIDLNVVDTDYHKLGIKFNNHHRKKNKANSLYVSEAPGVTDEIETFPKEHKKKKKHLDNTESSAILTQNFYISSHNTSEIQLQDNQVDLNVSATEADIDCHKLEINFSNHHRKKNKENSFNISEASTVTDEPEMFPKKHKKRKKKKHSNKTETYTVFNQNDCISNNSLKDYTEEQLENITDDDAQDSAKCGNFYRDEFTYFSTNIDCDEDPVDFEVPPLHQFESVSRLSEKQKNEFQDVFVKTGKFTAAEDKVIQKNFKRFVKRYGVSDPFSLFGIGRCKKDVELLKFLKAKHFYVRLAKGLNDRSLHSVYKRARIILHPFKNTGKLTENETEHLKQLYVTLSKKWQQIADTLGTTADRTVQTYRWHKKDVTKGRFSKEEETDLIEALKRVSGSSDISCKNMKHINWDAVATHVPSRNWSQCRMYWADNLAWAPESARKKWNKQCYRKLFEILKELNVENASEIDWYKVYESFIDFAPSDLYVLKRWLYARSRIPDNKTKSYKEILDILSKKYS